MNAQPWPLRPNTIGALGVTLGDGSAIDCALTQAALDGALPYTGVGLETYNYWTNAGGGYGMYFNATGQITPRNDPMPAVVQTWLSAYQQLPIVNTLSQVSQGSTDGWVQKMAAVLALYNRILTVEKLQAGGTVLQWNPPGGGTFAHFNDPSATADLPSGASLGAVVNFEQIQANQLYQELVADYPDVLGALPQAPFATLLGQSTQGGAAWGLVATPVYDPNAPGLIVGQAVTQTSVGVAAQTSPSAVAVVPVLAVPSDDALTGNAGVDNGGSPEGPIVAATTGPGAGGGLTSPSLVNTGPATQMVGPGNYVPPSPTPAAATPHWLAFAAVAVVVVLILKDL